MSEEFIYTKKNGDKIYCYGIAKEVLNGTYGLSIAYNYLDKKDKQRLSEYYNKKISGGADDYGEDGSWDGDHDLPDNKHNWTNICKHFEDYENRMVEKESSYPAICQLEAI